MRGIFITKEQELPYFNACCKSYFYISKSGWDMTEKYDFQSVRNTSLKFLVLVICTLQAPLKMLGRNLPLLKSVRVLLLSSVALHLAAVYWLQSFWVLWLAGLFKRCGRKKTVYTQFFHQQDHYWLTLHLSHTKVSQLHKMHMFIHYSSQSSYYILHSIFYILYSIFCYMLYIVCNILYTTE